MRGMRVGDTVIRRDYNESYVSVCLFPFGLHIQRLILRSVDHVTAKVGDGPYVKFSTVFHSNSAND